MATHRPYLAYECIESTQHPNDWLLTCEHASAYLPLPWQWGPGQEHLASSHWAIDLGARDLTIELAQHLGAPAILANFSRLLIDPNRRLDAEDLFRRVADGVPVLLNDNLSPTERQHRIDTLYRPYHAALQQAMTRYAPRLIFSVHTFTDHYQGQRRALELGVLVERDEAWGASLVAWLRRHLSAAVELNQPYSGKDGFMFSASHHAKLCGAAAVELEVRQDLVRIPQFRSALIQQLAAWRACLSADKLSASVGLCAEKT